MDKDETFFEDKVDQTNYTGCTYVIIIAVIAFAVGAYGLLTLSTWTKKQHWGTMLHLPNTPVLPKTDTSGLLEEIKTSIQSSAQKQVDKAGQAAADQIKQTTVNTLKNSITP